MHPNSLILIKQRLSSMSPVEKKIANSILEDPNRVVNSTIGNLAAAAGVAVSSVVNFAVSLGFKGFSEMKINLARSISSSPAGRPVEEDPADHPKALMRNLITQLGISFEDTYASMNDELEQAAKLLLQAKYIAIFSAGGTGALAQDAQYRLMRLGMKAFFAADTLYEGAFAAQMTEDSCVLAISRTGSTNSVITSSKIAQARGAKVIALTSFASSPLTRLADVSLTAVSGEASTYQEALVSRLTMLLLLDALCAYVHVRCGMEEIMPLDDEKELLENLNVHGASPLP